MSSFKGLVGFSSLPGVVSGEVCRRCGGRALVFRLRLDGSRDIAAEHVGGLGLVARWGLLIHRAASLHRATHDAAPFPEIYVDPRIPSWGRGGTYISGNTVVALVPSLSE